MNGRGPTISPPNHYRTDHQSPVVNAFRPYRLTTLISTIPTYSFLIHDHVLQIKGQKKYIRNVRNQKLTPKFSLKSPHPPLYITTQLISSIFSNCYWMPLGENGTNYMGHYGNKRKIIEITVFKPPIQEASREKIRFDSSRQTICKYP